MFKWLSKWARPAGRLRTADAQMQADALGRLPQDVAEGTKSRELPAEYVRETVEPSEDVWAREQERYRRRWQRDEGQS